MYPSFVGGGGGGPGNCGQRENFADSTQPILHWLTLGFCIEGDANFMFRIGGNANFSVFRYQHGGIPNTKLWRWGSKPTPGPNANGFASQWNIGFKLESVDANKSLRIANHVVYSHQLCHLLILVYKCLLKQCS